MNSLHPLVRIKEHMGIFAKKDIGAGQAIFHYFGTSITKPPTIDDKAFSPLYFNTIGISDGVWLNLDHDCLLRYINHSCSPSAYVERDGIIRAMRNINVGEEITIDYATTESDPYWSMECSCKSENCKGIVKAGERPYWKA